MVWLWYDDGRWYLIQYWVSNVNKGSFDDTKKGEKQTVASIKVDLKYERLFCNVYDNFLSALTKNIS